MTVFLEGVPDVHPIEAESMRVLASRVDLSHLHELQVPVVSRIAHACADISLVSDTVCPVAAVQAGIVALRAGAPIVTDVKMVAAGIWGGRARAWIRDERILQAEFERASTRTAAAMRLAVRETGPGAVYVIGCAPTALDELLGLAEQARPALVIGLPVGFVGAVEAKKALRASGLPQISNRSEKGGSGVAAAAANALLRLAKAWTGRENPADRGDDR